MGYNVMNVGSAAKGHIMYKCMDFAFFMYKYFLIYIIKINVSGGDLLYVNYFIFLLDIFSVIDRVLFFFSLLR